MSGRWQERSDSYAPHVRDSVRAGEHLLRVLRRSELVLVRTRSRTKLNPTFGPVRESHFLDASPCRDQTSRSPPTPSKTLWRKWLSGELRGALSGEMSWQLGCALSWQLGCALSWQLGCALSWQLGCGPSQFPKSELKQSRRALQEMRAREALGRNDRHSIRNCTLPNNVSRINDSPQRQQGRVASLLALRAAFGTSGDRHSSPLKARSSAAGSRASSSAAVSVCLQPPQRLDLRLQRVELRDDAALL